MAAYLTANRPARSQWYHRRNRPLTGCTVLHTAENVMDTVGPDTGAEAVAEFIRTRSTPGSYHDLVDSDSAIHLVEYEHGAFHDGTGSNNWALSLSFACSASDWARMSAERRAGFLRQGAAAFARQQAWRKANGFPMTDLRLLSKLESDTGASGFIYHGMRDPARRSDPGMRPPNLFPLAEFIGYCREAVAGATATEDDMAKVPQEQWDAVHERVAGRVYRGGQFTLVQEMGNVVAAAASARDLARMNAAELAGLRVAVDKLADAVATQQKIDPAALKAAVSSAIAESVVRVDVNVGQG